MDLESMDDRQFFALVGRRPGMYVGRPTYDKVASFITGCEQTARHYRRPGITGFQDWLRRHLGREGGPVRLSRRKIKGIDGQGLKPTAAAYAGLKEGQPVMTRLGLP